MTSEALAFVDGRRPLARSLGDELTELVDEPERFAAVARAGLSRLADPVYRAAQDRVAPGIRGVLGVRWPLLHAVERQLLRSLPGASPTTALYLADRLSRSEVHELRLLAHVCLRRSVHAEPERSWGVIRHLARTAHDWISVDSLAELVARGILLEPYRWAELEQLVYSPHVYERRLIGSTLARLPARLGPGERHQLRDTPALQLVRALIGDAEPEVQKALGWALRSWVQVDREGVERLLREEADTAARGGDGHRAWVIRDALAAQSPPLANELRDALGGLRRRAGQPSTSRAAQSAAAFHDFIARPGAV